MDCKGGNQVKRKVDKAHFFVGPLPHGLFYANYTTACLVGLRQSLARIQPGDIIEMINALKGAG